MTMTTKKEETLSVQTLQNFLVVSAADYYKKYVDSIPEGVDKIAKAKEDLKLLQDAGLGMSRNAKELTVIISGLVAESMGNMHANDIAVLLQKVREYCPTAIVVPYDDFFQVLKTYNLACGPIAAYKGVIPEDKVVEIAVASKQLANLRNLNQLKHIEKIRLDSDIPSPIQKQVIEYFSRFPYVLSEMSSGWEYMRSIGQDDYRDSLSFSSARSLSFTDWCIAAPVKDMTDNITIELYSGAEEKRKAIVQDPIVFKVHQAGVIICSMWGEEASSDIFNKYK